MSICRESLLTYFIAVLCEQRERFRYLHVESLRTASVYCSASNRKNNNKKRIGSPILTTMFWIFCNRSAVKKRSGTYKMLQATTTVFVVAACLQFVVIELFKAKRDTASC